MTDYRAVDLWRLRQQWIDTQRFKIYVRRILAREKVSFTQWLVLEAIVEVEHPAYPCVYQLLVAEYLSVSERVVSYTMKALVKRRLVERDMEDSPQYWHVELTAIGEKTLQRCRERLQDALRGSSFNLAA